MSDSNKLQNFHAVKKKKDTKNRGMSKIRMKNNEKEYEGGKNKISGYDEQNEWLRKLKRDWNGLKILCTLPPAKPRRFSISHGMGYFEY